MSTFLRITFLGIAVAVFFSGHPQLATAQEQCAPCHEFCNFDPEKDYRVLETGVSTVNVPIDFVSETECYEECPPSQGCPGGAEESPEPEALAEAMVTLGVVKPVPARPSPFHPDIEVESGFYSKRPRLVRTACGLGIRGLPSFADLASNPT